MTSANGDLSRVLLRTAQDLALLGARVESLEGVSAKVESLSARVESLPSGGDLKEVFGELSANLQALGDRLASLEATVNPADETRGKVWDFTRMQGDSRAAAWQRLQEWVTTVVGGWYDCLAKPSGEIFPSDKRADRAPKVPACWHDHPDLVLELAWLCQEWDAAMAGSSPTKVGDWHDRYWPNFRRRLRDSSAGKCLANGHKATPPTG